MQKTDLELQEAVIAAMEFAETALSASDMEVAYSDFISELAVYGYKIVKDTD